MIEIVRPFVWQDGRLDDLGALNTAEPFYARAHAINNLGQIVGTTSGFYGFTSVPTLWQNGRILSMGAIPGSEVCVAQDINDQGVAIGTCNSDFVGSSRAFIWTQQSGLKVLIPAQHNEDYTAEALNEKLEVVGSYYDGLRGFAYLWINDSQTPLDGDYAYDINSAGQIVGSQSQGPNMVAVVWHRGVAAELGTLGGPVSVAYGISQDGSIVGTSSTKAGAFHAFVYTSGVMKDLNSLISSDAGWILQEARAVNDQHEIVGSGVSPNGQTHGFLLRPIGPGDLNGDGQVGPADLAQLLATWGQCPTPPEPCPADLTGDGAVGPADLAQLLAHWS
jgi:probable HAF family extracellular repeat protein